MRSRREISAYERIADVRSWTVRASEWLSSPVNLMIFTVGLCILMVTIPALLVIVVPAYIIAYLNSLFVEDLMPFRYPVGVQGKESPRGILFFGNIYVAPKPKDRLPLDDVADQFKEVWLADSDLRMHFFILGSTGSGKSEALKSMFFSALTWGSGFFVADGKADNKLALDNFALAKMFGRDDDLLIMNFLLAGSTPQQVANSKVKRTNGLNPFYLNDADTIIQMGSNLLPKAEGEGKAWQDRALNFWRGLVPALVDMRDTNGIALNVGHFIEYLSLSKVEQLYAHGASISLQKSNGTRHDAIELWPDAYLGIKSYCESGLPGFKVDRVLRKHLPERFSQSQTPGGFSLGPKKADDKTEQDATVFDQHGYRASQMAPALNLLDRTYGHIFRASMSEIEMVDVTLNNRILSMMIPSLEKSSMEAENLGKLAVACLRTMMGKNLGAEVEGRREKILEAKATEAPYPYLVALDELGYYFSDGLAVMFAQARSLGFCMIAAAQDVEKLFEGSRAPEAGAMLANSFAKYFMRIDDAQKTNEMIQKYLGEATVAVRHGYDFKGEFGHRRNQDINIEKVPVATLQNMQAMKMGQGMLNAMGKRMKIQNFYVGDYLGKNKVEDFHVNRFMQILPLTDHEVELNSVPSVSIPDSYQKGMRLLEILRGIRRADPDACASDAPYGDQYDQAKEVINRISKRAQQLPSGLTGAKRGIALYQEAIEAMKPVVQQSEDTPLGASRGGSAHRDRPADPIVSESSGSNASAVTPAPLGLGSKVDMAQALALEPDDPLSFLNDGRPLQRRDASAVLAPIDPENQLIAKSSGVLSPSSQDKSLAQAPLPSQPPREELQQVPAVLFDPIEQLLGRGMALNILTPAGASFQAQRPTGQPAQSSSDDQWIGDALAQTRDSLASRGQTLVGFTDQAREALVRLESAMGNPQPGQGADIVEQMVAERTTPPQIVTEEPADVDALMAEIEKSLSQGN